jgi:glutaminase
MLAVVSLTAGGVMAQRPEAERLQQAVTEAHTRFQADRSGKNADYIPALAKVPADLFGVVIATAGGEVFVAGDVDVPFSIQSCSKVFTMCHVMQESGAEAIFEKINVEPTGEAFNSIRAIEEGDGRADNPLVNAGAIATVSLVRAKNADERWMKIQQTLSRFAGEELQVIDEIYQSEAATNFRNRGIAHVLFNSKHLFCDPLEATDVNPRTGVRALDDAHVPRVLAVMMMSGFYDGSGSWAWRAGLPAKTGVGGGIFAVVPGQMCIAASPLPWMARATACARKRRSNSSRNSSA